MALGISLSFTSLPPSYHACFLRTLLSFPSFMGLFFIIQKNGKYMNDPAVIGLEESQQKQHPVGKANS